MRAAALVVLAVAVVCFSEATAAISVSVAPPFIEKVTRPSSSVRDVILFRNGGTETLTVSVSFVDFGVGEDGTVHEKPPGTDRSSVLPFARITPLRMRVAPSQEVFFRYTVKAPADFKQLRAMVMFSGLPDVAGGGNQVVFAPRVGVPLYVESTAARPASLQIETVEWKRMPGSKDQIALTMSVRNAGDRNIRPNGTVRVRSAEPPSDQAFAFNEGREPVLPGQKRNWTLTFGPVPGGELSVNLRFTTSFRDTFSGDYRVPAAAP